MRARRRVRAWRMGRKLILKSDKTRNISENGIIVFTVIHNELQRLPFFLDYYRKMGVNHFVFVDNKSSDQTSDYLSQQDDVTLYYTDQSYRNTHFGMDWVNFLLLRYARNRWALTVDVDEFLVFPHCDKRPIQALTDYLDDSRVGFFAAQLLDLYPDKKLKNTKVKANSSPLDILTHFDVGNYTFKENSLFGNLWIQGGVRMRVFFEKHPQNAPALNKVPLVKWKRGYVYTSSTHQLLPQRLNRSHATEYGERICGALLHTKFLPDIRNKVENPYLLSQHYLDGMEYQSYNQAQLDDLNFQSSLSTKYQNWRQLDRLGIISQGGWA